MSENSYLITLLQKENQTIIAYEVDDKGNYTGVEHTKSFFAKANSKWKFTVIPDKFHEDYWIHIIQSDHQTITVKDNATYHDYRAGVLVSYPDDDKLTGIQAGDLDSGIYPETNYDVAGEEPHDRYKYLVVNQNCRVFATLAVDLYNETDYHKVIIKQVSHQTIVFTYRNKKYYGNTVVQNNEDYTVELIPDSGYTSTSLIINGKTINSLKYSGKATTDLAITAVQANVTSNYLEFTFKEFESRVERLNNSNGKLIVGRLSNTDIGKDPNMATVTVIQPTNATIHVYTPKKEGGIDHTTTFTVPKNTTFEAEIIGNEGVLPGDLCIGANKDEMCTVSILQPSNATIHVWTPKKNGGVDHTSTFTVPKNTTYEAEIIGNEGVLPGDLSIGADKDDAAKNLKFIYLYKKYKIKNTPLLFTNDTNLYVSSLYDRSNLIYSGTTNNPKITSNNFIQSEILKYYGFDYLFGYFNELEGSAVSNKTLSVKNSSNKLTLRLLGFNLFKMSTKSNKKSGRWVLGFNENTNVKINSISLYIFDDTNSEIAKINNFNYLNTINGDTNDSNKVVLYYSNSLNNDLDSSYLYLLSNKDKKAKIRLLIE